MSPVLIALIQAIGQTVISAGGSWLSAEIGKRQTGATGPYAVLWSTAGAAASAAAVYGGAALAGWTLDPTVTAAAAGAGAAISNGVYHARKDDWK